MKKTVNIFVLCFLVLAGLALWIFKGKIALNLMQIIEVGCVIVVVGFAVYVGVSRLRSQKRGEPGEDELSRKVMLRASSLSFYISLYIWLFVMYISDKTTLPTHSLIGAGDPGDGRRLPVKLAGRQDLRDEK